MYGKMRKKKLGDIKNLSNIIPYDNKKEISGYIKGDYIYFKEGNRYHAPSFSNEELIFHTHVDIKSTKILTYPDIPSPVDILTFLFSDNNEILIIKSRRLIMTFVKTNESDEVKKNILGVIRDNIKKYKKLHDAKKYNDLFCYIITEFTKNKNLFKNSSWELLWKDITKNILKIDVFISASDVN
jgi:hypothetical protein